MDYQILSSTTETKDKWVGPGIYRLVSAAYNGKYLAVDDQDNLVVASGSKKNDDYKQQWQISYAGKRQLEGDPKEVFVTEFFIINVETGKYLTHSDSSLSVSLSSPKFDGESRWVLVNRRITEKNQAFDDRYIFYTWKTKLVLACNGTKIISNSYNPEDENPSEQSQWHIIDNITS